MDDNRSFAIVWFFQPSLCVTAFNYRISLSSKQFWIKKASKPTLRRLVTGRGDRRRTFYIRCSVFVSSSLLETSNVVLCTTRHNMTAHCLKLKSNMQLVLFLFFMFAVNVSGFFHQLPTAVTGTRFLHRSSLEAQNTPPIIDKNGNYRGCYCIEQGIKAKSLTCSKLMCGVYKKEEKIRKQEEAKTTKK